MNMKVLAQTSTNECIIIVNYEGSGDSIRCIESILRLTGFDCDEDAGDNHAHDQSWGKIRSFVKSKFPDARPVAGSFTYLPYEAMRIEGAESYGVRPFCTAIIRTTANLGIDAGNNVGIRHSLSTGNADYVSLLYNDKAVEPNLLSGMLNRMEPVPEAGICGFILLYQDNAHRIQVLGGLRCLEWTDLGVRLNTNGMWPAKVRAESTENETSCVSAASILISKVNAVEFFRFPTRNRMIFLFFPRGANRHWKITTVG
jgi:hypothetical protein